MKLQLEIQMDNWISTADVNSAHLVTGVESTLAVVIAVRRNGVSSEHVMELTGRDRVKAWAEIGEVLAQPTINLRQWISPEDYADGQMDSRAEILAEQGFNAQGWRG